ncbi:MAG: class I SAM-dependent methyltransferase [Dehalococcoidia bacterium]
METHEAYADPELAALYDLVYDGFDDDVPLYENFARRGELPSLELGVGSGRVALHLARSGLSVVGIDTSLHMLARVEAALDRETAPRLRLVEGDMRDFGLGGERFDLIYCAFDTWEHLLTPEDQLSSLRCVAKHLAKGGVFVAQLRLLTSVDWSVGLRPLALEWTRRDPASGELVTKLIGGRASPAQQTTTDVLIFDRMPADGGAVRRRTFEGTLRVTGRFEMELLLQRAGLRLAGLYGGTDLSPFDDAGDTMVIVAEPGVHT